MALTLRRFFEPKVTILYPEVPADDPAQVPRPAAAPLRRVGHAQVRDLLPVRPGLPDRVHRHGRHRHEGPLRRPLGRARDVRRAARGVGPPAIRPDGAGRGVRALPRPIDLAAGRRDPRRGRPRSDARCSRSSRRPRPRYGYLPVAALKRISDGTGAWYAMIYGTATYYDHLARRAPGTARRAPTTRYGRGARGRPSDGRPPTTGPAGPGHERPMTDLLPTPTGWPRSCSGRPRPPTRPTSTRPSRAGAFEALRTRGPGDDPGPASIADVVGSGLRGRGGAGFPTADEVAGRGERRRTHPLRRRQRLRRRPGGPDRPDADGARPVRRHRGPGHRRLCDRRGRGDHRRPGRRRPRRSAGSRRPSAPPRRPASSGPTSLESGRGPGRSRSGPSRAPTCSARRRSCSRRSRASAASPSSGRRIRRSAGCSAARPSSRTSRPWRACPGSSANGAEAYAAIGSTASPGTILVQRPRRRPAAGSPRCRSGRRSASSSRSPPRGAADRTATGRSRPSSSAGPSGGILPADLLDTPYDFDVAPRGRRARRVGLDRRGRRPGLRRRPGPAADPLLRRRGLRQDDPLPDRHPPPVRDRRPDRGRHARARPTPSWPPTWPPTSEGPACATTSGWRRFR